MGGLLEALVNNRKLSLFQGAVGDLTRWTALRMIGRSQKSSLNHILGIRSASSLSKRQGPQNSTKLGCQVPVICLCQHKIPRQIVWSSLVMRDQSFTFGIAELLVIGGDKCSKIDLRSRHTVRRKGRSPMLVKNQSWTKESASSTVIDFSSLACRYAGPRYVFVLVGRK